MCRARQIIDQDFQVRSGLSAEFFRQCPSLPDEREQQPADDVAEDEGKQRVPPAAVHQRVEQVLHEAPVAVHVVDQRHVARAVLVDGAHQRLAPRAAHAPPPAAGRRRTGVGVTLAPWTVEIQ